MKNFPALLIVVLTLSMFFFGCTERNRAKQWGGKLTVKLEPGQKLVNATWKDSDLWYLTRPMHSGEHPESYQFTEESNFGVFQGSVKFIESNADSILN